MDATLSPWDKLGIMGLGAIVVAVTILLVACTTCMPGFCLHTYFHPEYGQKRKKPVHSNVPGCPETIIDYGPQRCRVPGSVERLNQINENLGNMWEQESIRSCVPDSSSEDRSKSVLRLARSDSTYGSMSSGHSSPSARSLGVSLSNMTIGRSSSAGAGGVQQVATSYPLSPTATPGAFRGTAVHRSASLPKEGESGKHPASNVNLSVLFQPLPPPQHQQQQDAGQANHDAAASSGKLIVFLNDIRSLPPRDYCYSRDPFVHIAILKDRRSLRKKTKQMLAEFKTKIIRHQLNPVYDQSFSTEIQTSDVKNARIKVTVMDYDKHTKVCPIGSTSIALRDVKNLQTAKDPIGISGLLQFKKQEFGEVLFGLSYLPTAQRVSFSIIKALNLKFEELEPPVEGFRPYIRIIQMSISGRVMRKKKSEYQEQASKEPVFNETLNFDVAPQQLDTVSFVLMIAHKRQPSSDNDSEEVANQAAGQEQACSGSTLNTPSLTHSSSSRSVTPTMGVERATLRDPVLGRVSLGFNVRGEKERAHWMSVMSTPRKVFTMWHTLT